jgi:PIN domain nuclease of toxin-antitoxin system
MKILLDTHTFLWWDSDPERLSKAALELCGDSKNSLFLSAASVWEMQIKIQLGKLKIDLPLSDLILQQEINGVEILPVHVSHVFEISNLPAHHKDPFDRLLIAQVRVEGMVFVSADPVIAQYPVKVVW